jgi:hypothetical protein
MKVYKITYVNNAPISCRLVTDRVIEGAYTYEFNKDNLIFAFVNADDEREALEISKFISAKFTQTGLLIQ